MDQSKYGITEINSLISNKLLFKSFSLKKCCILQWHLFLRDVVKMETFILFPAIGYCSNAFLPLYLEQSLFYLLWKTDQIDEATFLLPFFFPCSLSVEKNLLLDEHHLLYRLLRMNKKPVEVAESSFSC